MTEVAARSSIAFSQPPKFIGLPGQANTLTYSANQLDQAVEAAYNRGSMEARGAAEAETTKLRAEAKAVIEGALSKVSEQHQYALAQMRALLPKLVSEATARVVAGVEVDGELVRSVVNDLLGDVTPGSDAVEVQLCPADLAKVVGFDQELRHKFPNIHLTENRELQPKDCVVKTRFGVLDGRIASKLKSVEGLLS
jgi:flagellar assembly protein FliH